MKVVIIGGVAGGASAAARLRRLDETAEIVILEKGNYISYANCGLPYYIGGKITNKSALTLQTPQKFYRRFRVDVRVCNEVIAIKPVEKSVVVYDSTTERKYEETYDKLIIATGAKPVVADLREESKDRIFTLRTVEDTLNIAAFIEKVNPKQAVIVGGGYIGLEMAENLLERGIVPTIVQRSSHVMGSVDIEIAHMLQQYMKEKGIQLRLQNRVQNVERVQERLEVHLTNGEVLPADMMIMSTGVTPDTPIVERAGLRLGAKASVDVNEALETSYPDIYAVGDAVEVVHYITGKKALIPLAGPANKQGRIVADNIHGKSEQYKGTQGSSIMKMFGRTVATTGINEKIAKEQGFAYDKIFLNALSHAEYYPDAKNIFMKVIFEKNTGKILGAQLWGSEGVDKRCDVIATAMRFGATAKQLTELELCYAPPFSSAKDPVNIAGFMIENILQGLVKQYHYHEIESLQNKGDVQMLDVRTKEEYQAGHIAGALHIPVDTLREHIAELDQTKPVYVNCQTGLRSYIACRILTANGFDSYNLAGGYGLYQQMQQECMNHRTQYPCGIEIK